MPLPYAPALVLPDADRARLEQLHRAASTPQALAFRVCIILRAAAADQPTNGTIAEELACHRHTVALWRHRFLQQGLPGLQAAPRPGRPRLFSPGRTP